MTVLERIFPSLRKSPEAKEAKSQLAEARSNNTEALDRFMEAAAGMIDEFDQLRKEANARKKRGSKNAPSRKQ